MTLKDLLKKKEKVREDVMPHVTDPPPREESPPPFTIMRSDTNTQELIRPPTFASEVTPQPPEYQHSARRFSRLRSASNVSTSSKASSKADKSEKRLSQRLHLRTHSRNSSQNSVNVPSDLPDIKDLSIEPEEKEAKWEERATILANSNPIAKPPAQDGHHPRPITPNGNIQNASATLAGTRPTVERSVSSAQGDENIQEAIRLHEAGDLVNSTAMFGRLAEGNAMAQILYGLALRHGWGIQPDPPRAIQYLSAAAASSASVESAALSSGMKKGGAAKGELVLAIYELANSFRHGWGVHKDPIAARKYYETAANLGDTDAMNEVARCYEVGDGGKKDRVRFSSVYSTHVLEALANFAFEKYKAHLRENLCPFKSATPNSVFLASHQIVRAPTVHTIISHHIRHRRIITNGTTVHRRSILPSRRTKRQHDPRQFLVSFFASFFPI